MRVHAAYARAGASMAITAAVLLAGRLGRARAQEIPLEDVSPEELQSLLDEGATSDTEMYEDEAGEATPGDEPGEPAEAGPAGSRVIVRPSLWLAWSTSRFRNGPAGTTFSLEGDERTEDFGVFPMHFILPLEGLIRTKNQELRLRYLWWTRESSAQSGVALDFGSASFGVADSVTASLQTHAIGLDLLHRILAKDRFDLYLAAAGDIFYTKLRLSGAGKSGNLEELPLILSVGLGVRFNVRPDVSVFLVHRALSFAQVFFIEEEFFGGRDVYRDLELALMWEKTDKIDLGVGLRHYEVSFESTRLEASQIMTGVSCWARFKF